MKNFIYIDKNLCLSVNIRFFKKHYLRSDTKFEGSLKEPNKNINYYLDLLKVKLTLFYIKLFN